jgi:hypothetical protein
LSEPTDGDSLAGPLREGGRPHDKQRTIGAVAMIDHVDARDGDTN